MSDPLKPGATIGILGGGQLGRMLAMAAARLGYRTHIFEPGDAPAAQAATALTTAGYDDTEALDAFADACDVVTFEFENVPADALDRIEAKTPIRPDRRALATTQDRMTEKDFLTDAGLVTARYVKVDTQGDMAAALAQTGVPAILKTRRLGYDGKGQVRIDDPAAAMAALEQMNGAPAILEAVVPFVREVSVIVARSADGKVEAYDPGENVHEGGILQTTRLPANMPVEVQDAAVDVARRIVEALDYVGVMGVEMFILDDGGIVVNEIAPRVHNSGHWTEAACAVDQFEQHIRAVAGLPLGQALRHSDVEMTNLIGTDDLTDWLGQPKARIHLYGKAEARPGRKMGHVTRLTDPVSGR